MPRAPGFEYYERPERWGLPRPDMSGITFYPELYWAVERIPLYPEHWDPESAVPRLFCSASPYHIDGIPNDPRDPEHKRIVAALIKHGFGPNFDPMNGQISWYEGTIHVDDIEKIEGPPPEGSF